MNASNTVIKQPRRLVAYIYDGYPQIIDYMSENSQPGRPQLVYKTKLPDPEKPSRSSWLAARVGLKKERKSTTNDTVAEAYTFLSNNYEPGDQVILRVDPYIERYQASLLNTAETLAQHL
ncbi:unnamed protein product, partial [Rhizoctonia solani]